VPELSHESSGVVAAGQGCINLILIISWVLSNLSLVEIDGYKIEPNSDLHRAELSAIDLKFANLDKADLSEAELSGSDLSFAILTGANLRAAWVNTTSFFKVNGPTSIFDDCRAHDAVFSSANLKNSSFAGAELCCANFVGADLRASNFRNANLEGCNLSGADLAGADLSGANLSNAILDGAKFARSKLVGANLSASSCVETNFNQANLSHCKLIGTIVGSFSYPIYKSNPIALDEMNSDAQYESILVDRFLGEFGGEVDEFEDFEIELIEFPNFFHAKFAGANLCGVDLTAVEIAGDSGDISQADILKAIFKSAKR
jgi:uncharacterized protein YjbI with pentapeptide repeats